MHQFIKKQMQILPYGKANRSNGSALLHMVYNFKLVIQATVFMKVIEHGIPINGQEDRVLVGGMS